MIKIWYNAQQKIKRKSDETNHHLIIYLYILPKIELEKLYYFSNFLIIQL